jgi:hypothetical protein
MIALRRLRKRLQRCQLFLRISARIDFRMDLRDAPLLIDHVRDPPGVLILRRISGAVRQTDLVVCIAQQRKVEFLLLREFAIGFDAVEGGADDLDVLRGVLGGEVSEPETFGGSAGCVGLRKEPQHDFLATKVAELYATTHVIGSLECGSSITDFQHRRTSSCTLQQITDHSGK